MSHELEDLFRRVAGGPYTNSDPLIIPFNLSPAELRNFVIAVKISAVTGAGPTYASGVVETTWDGGGTWETVTDVETEDVTGTGIFRYYATSITGVLSPVCRLVLTPAAAHTVTVSQVNKTRFAPGYSPSQGVPSPTGGSATVSVVDPIGQDTMANSVSVAIASDQSSLPIELTDVQVVDTARRDYSVDNLTAAWTTVFTPTVDIKGLSIFDSGGQTLELGWGGVRYMYIPPGGTSERIAIPSGTAVQIKTISGTLAIGENVINALA